jgi:hypothetical protein
MSIEMLISIHIVLLVVHALVVLMTTRGFMKLLTRRLGVGIDSVSDLIRVVARPSDAIADEINADKRVWDYPVNIHTDQTVGAVYVTLVTTAVVELGFGLRVEGKHMSRTPLATWATDQELIRGTDAALSLKDAQHNLNTLIAAKN